MINRPQLLLDNTVICPAPFTTITLKPAGENISYSCCCNLNVQGTADINEIQENIRLNIPSRRCKLCYVTETHGGQSERRRLIMSMQEHELEQLINNYSVDEQEVFIKFSNLCSLACRSCMPADSTTYTKIIGVIGNAIPDMSEDPEHWLSITKLLHKYSNSVKPIVHLIGGETLIQDGAIKIIHWLKDNNLANKFELRITTSLAVNLNNELKNLFVGFRQLTLVLSIDSVGDNYHYVRWPAKFNKIENNLQILVDLSKQLSSYVFVVQPLFSLNNILYLNDYVEYFNRWIYDNHIMATVFPIHLNYPENLSLAILPPEYASIVVDQIDQAIGNINLTHQYVFYDHLLSLKQTVSKKYSKSMFNSFLQFTANFDKRTNTKFEIYNDRLWNILTPEHQEFYNKHYVQSKI